MSIIIHGAVFTRSTYVCQNQTRTKYIAGADVQGAVDEWRYIHGLDS